MISHRFEAWQQLLANQNTLFLNLTLIVLSTWSVWFLHIRKSKRLQIIFWIGIYVIYFGSFVYSYLTHSTGT